MGNFWVNMDILTHFLVGYINFLSPLEILNFGGRFMGIIGTKKGKVDLGYQGKISTLLRWEFKYRNILSTKIKYSVL